MYPYLSLGQVAILEINLYWWDRRKIWRCRWDEKRAEKWSVLMIYEDWRVMEETAKIGFRFHIYLKAQQHLYIWIYNNQPRESNIQSSISRKLSSVTWRKCAVASAICTLLLLYGCKLFDLYVEVNAQSLFLRYRNAYIAKISMVCINWLQNFILPYFYPLKINFYSTDFDAV